MTSLEKDALDFLNDRGENWQFRAEDLKLKVDNPMIYNNGFRVVGKEGNVWILRAGNQQLSYRFQ